MPDAGAAAFGLESFCPYGDGTSAVVVSYSFVGSGAGATLTLIVPEMGSEVGVFTLVRQR